jgi:hypothetical protein
MMAALPRMPVEFVVRVGKRVGGYVLGGIKPLADGEGDAVRREEILGGQFHLTANAREGTRIGLTADGADFTDLKRMNRR